RQRLLAGESLGVRPGRLVGGAGLVDVGRLDGEAEAEPAQQLRPTRRAGGEDELGLSGHGGQRSSRIVTGPSFTSSTSIMAPNSPVWTSATRSRRVATNRS